MVPNSDPKIALLGADLNSAAECKAALEALAGPEGHRHPMLVAAARDHALRRWLELDAESALGFAEGDVRSDYEPGVAAELFRVWLDLDVESALDSFAQSSPALVRSARISFFRNLAQIDPERAVAELSDPKWDNSLPRWDHAPSAVLSIWAQSDPRAAAEAASAWKVDDGASPLLAVARIWAEADPVAALAFLDGLEDPTRQRVGDARRLAAGYLLQADPAADIGNFKGYDLTQIARAWAARDIEAAIAFADARDPGDQLARDLRAQAAKQLATSEPARALDLIGDAPGKDYPAQSVLRQAFASLTSEDAAGAMERWRTLPEEQQHAALVGVATHLFAADQVSAIEEWKTWLDDPALEKVAMSAVALSLNHFNGGGANDLGQIVEEIPEFRDHVNGHLLSGWVKIEPEEAAGFVAERVLEKGGDDIDDPETVGDLVMSRPEFTSTWLPTLLEGAFRNNTAAALAANWSRFNPDAASAWVEGLDAGAMKEAAAAALGK